LDDSNIFVLPSITTRDGDQEGIPNAIKEAMARGLPVVSTYHAGIPELIEDGISGFLVPECNEKALAEKIEYVISHPEIWQSIEEAGRKKIEEEYDKEKINDRLIEIFNQLVA